MPKKRKFLVISAHPDDLDFACGGTMAKLTGEGNEVVELIVSDGSKGSHKVGFGGRKLAAVREKEERKAAKVLRAKEVHFLKEKDGELENTRALRKKLAAFMRKVKPDVVLSGEPSYAFENTYRSHRDHRMAAEAVFDAIYPAVGNASFFPELLKKGLKPHQIGELWFWGATKPDKRVDISKTMELKIKALACHESQIVDMKGMAERIRERARETGRGRYVEAFRVLKLS
ncbi:MAG: PIG-L deacetylase family protein [bacterium]|nr:PIG-L deacetylase family protein [bacterium]